MPIDLETIKRTAELARLDPTHGLSPEAARAALEKLSRELSTIVGYIDVLGEADTEGVEPLYSPMLQAPGPREDRPRVCPTTEEILSQAPGRFEDFFSVPKIL